MLTVKKNYRDVPYHNWTHAFAVAHSMYLVIRSGNDKFTALEVWDLEVMLQCWYNVVTIRNNVATMLQRCVVLKIVVANRLV